MIKVTAKITLIIVGFMYKKTGLLKYNVNPPNNEMMIPPTRGIYEVHSSHRNNSRDYEWRNGNTKIVSTSIIYCKEN